MKRLNRSFLVVCVGMAACCVANAQTKKIEGTAAIAAGSINPPNPVEGCNRAKRDAEDKAVKAGTKGLVSWDRLSVDSDCSLSTPGGTGIGYFYIFTAKGNFKT